MGLGRRRVGSFGRHGVTRWLFPCFWVISQLFSKF
jgi:hypothetical protein